MKWAIIILVVFGLIFIGLGVYVDKTGRSADESLGAVVPWAIAGVFLAIAGLLFLGKLIYMVLAE